MNYFKTCTSSKAQKFIKTQGKDTEMYLSSRSYDYILMGYSHIERVTLSLINSNIVLLYCPPTQILGILGGSAVKNPPAMQETQVQSLGLEYSLEKKMATHCSILAWETLWTEEPGGLQSMEPHKS